MAQNEIKNFSTSYNLLAKSISQVIYFLTNCFTFLAKFWIQIKALTVFFCKKSKIQPHSTTKAEKCENMRNTLKY